MLPFGVFSFPKTGKFAHDTFHGDILSESFPLCQFFSKLLLCGGRPGYRSAVATLPPFIESLLRTETLPALRPERRDGVSSIKQIEAASAQKLGATPNGELARALLLLWHDHLDAAHAIAQKHETPDGSYVHAIMHRREGDYGNSKYWFRRVGAHPCFSLLFDETTEKYGAFMKSLTAKQSWDPFAFVDACEKASSRDIGSLQEIQALEVRLLLSHLLATRG